MTILILQRTRQRNIMCEALPNGIVGLRTQRVKLIRINVEITLAVNSERPQQHLPQNTIFKVGMCWELDIGGYTLYTFLPRDIPGKRITNYWDDKNTPTQTSCSTLFASFLRLLTRHNTYCEHNILYVSMIYSIISHSQLYAILCEK